jgi:hypothetical protein
MRTRARVRRRSTASVVGRLIVAIVLAAVVSLVAPKVSAAGAPATVAAHGYDQGAPTVGPAWHGAGRLGLTVRLGAATEVVRKSLLAGFGVAAKGGKTLYRAVGPEELADIQKVGGYRVKSGMAEGKYFFDTPEQASNFARMMGKQPYTTTSVRVSGSNLAKGQRINPAKEGPGYFFDTSDVPWGTVRVWDRSVLP